MNTANDDRRENTLRSDESKSPESLEREVDEARARVGRTANELSDRLSPGELLDQALGMAREHAGEFTRNLGSQVKSNPLPMILTGIGISWMMMSSRDGGGGGSGSYGSSRSYATRYGEEGGDSTNGLGHRIKDGVEDGLNGLSDTAHRSFDKAQDKAHEIGDRIHGATASMKDSAKNARENMAEFYREQPLIAGSIGIAIGAALGSLVPATEMEDDMFGQARDRSLDAVKLEAGKKYDEVRDSVRESVRDSM